MKPLDGPEDLDLVPTHFRCVDEDETYELGADYGDPRELTLYDITCPEELDDEDHPVEFIHESAVPLASPGAVKDSLMLQPPWGGLSEFDADHWHYGRRVFAYTLVDE